MKLPVRRIQEEPALERHAPHNAEAERQLLGAILVNNETYYRVSDFLEPAHFWDILGVARNVHALRINALVPKCQDVAIPSPLWMEGLTIVAFVLNVIGGNRFDVQITNGEDITVVHYYSFWNLRSAGFGEHDLRCRGADGGDGG